MSSQRSYTSPSSPRRGRGRWDCQCDATQHRIHTHCECADDECALHHEHVVDLTNDAYQAKMINRWDGRHRLTTEFLTDLHLIQCNVCLAVFTRGQWRFHQRACAAAPVAASRTMADMNDDEIEEKYDSETTEVDDIGAEDNTQLQQEPSAVSPEPTQIDLTENDTPLTLTLTPTLTPRRSARSRTANEHYSESMFELSGRRQQVRESPPLVRQSRARTVSLSPPVLPSIPATHLPHTLLSTYSDEQLPILYNAPRVERRVPQSCIPLWVQATAMYRTDYQHARATDDEARATNALWQFMTLPARTMRLMRGGRRKRHRNIFRIRDRLLDIISGRNDHSAPGLRKAMRDRIISTAAPTEAAIDDAAMTRVARFVADGYLRKAKQALKSTQPLAPTADVEILKQLKTLHPQRTQAPPPLPLAATDYILTKSEMRLFVRDVIAMDNGTSGGPSQWTGHMLRVLTDNSECMRGLMCIINDIINGKVPTAARDLVTSSHLVAARKGDGRNGIRPIAIGEVLYRLASRCVNSAVLPHVGANLLNQYGVGDRNGAAHRQLDTKEKPVSSVPTPFSGTATQLEKCSCF